MSDFFQKIRRFFWVVLNLVGIALPPEWFGIDEGI